MNRIKELRVAAGLKQAELAEMIGVRQNTLSTWETGRHEPDIESMTRMAKIFGASVDEIIGNGAISDKLPENSRDHKWIPVLGDVAAGIPIEAVENIIDWEEISDDLAATGEFFALRVKGSSMEPRIKEGDVVIVRRQEDANTGDTAVVIVNGDSATVKRIKKEPDGSLWLLPNNPAYDPQHFSPAEIIEKPVSILGKVVELRGKF